MTPKFLLHAFVEAMNARDWTRLGELLDPDLVFELPQRGERITGRDGYIAFNAEDPAAWRIEPEVVLADEHDGCVRFRWVEPTGESIGIVFVEFGDGVITRITDFFVPHERRE